MIQFITFFYLISIFVFDSNSMFYSRCFAYATICAFSPQPCKNMGEISIKMGKMDGNSSICHSIQLGQVNSVCKRFFPKTVVFSLNSCRRPVLEVCSVCAQCPEQQLGWLGMQPVALCVTSGGLACRLWVWVSAGGSQA